MLLMRLMQLQLLFIFVLLCCVLYTLRLLDLDFDTGLFIFFTKGLLTFTIDV